MIHGKTDRLCFAVIYHIELGIRNEDDSRGNGDTHLLINFGSVHGYPDRYGSVSQWIMYPKEYYLNGSV